MRGATRRGAQRSDRRPRPSARRACCSFVVRGSWHRLPRSDACGAATTAGGAAELVDGGVEGFLVAPGDVGALADRSGSWVTDRALVARMGAVARERARRHPTWARSLEPVRQLL